MLNPIEKPIQKSPEMKQNQLRIPINNILGPFPDEPITECLDRLLYYLRGCKLFKYFTDSPINSARNDDPLTTNTHNGISKDCSESRNNQNYGPRNKTDSPICVLAPIESMNFKNSSKSNYRKQEIAGEQKEHSFAPQLKRSSSLDSLVSKKIKGSLYNEPIKSSSKWLCTKLHNYSNGCKVYEIFTNSSNLSYPQNHDENKEQKIIFITLPSGNIIPFETLKRHC
ncbi:uncharacterized protein LOC142224952 [Haematobia irritans]|uniref:uncharacterized protein LOC142224952 n=1 Tax=Haematobia irritans TaxID=7368 RepID=UPI003F50820E